MRGTRPAQATAPALATPVVEALEPRLLYSADIAPLLLPAADPMEAAWVATPLPAAPASASAAQHDTAPVTASAQALTEIVFIDSTVPDAGALLHDLHQQIDRGRPLEVIVIEPDEDGWARIDTVLATRHDIGALHLIGHGQSGQMQLGSTVMDQDTLMARAADIAQWRSALDEGADILLYGCDVGSTLQGRELVNGLAVLTGADVAANDNPTGASARGGDWTLDVQQGRIDTAVAFSAAAQAEWDGLLTSAMPSGKGSAVFNDAGSTKPLASGWDGVTLSGSANTAVTANWTVITSAQSATRDEAIVVGVDGDGVIRGQMWNGSTWSALPQNPMSTNAVDNRQGFAVAYEQQSGDAILMWGSGSRVYYSTWNGSTWSTTTSVNVGSDTVERLQVAHKPGSDQMVVALSDADDDKYAMIWNGTQFTKLVALDSSGSDSSDQLALAVAYESQSGAAMVAYGKHGDPGVYYRLFNGFSWSAETSAGNFGSSGSTLSIYLGSDPNSDRLVMAQTILVSTGSNSYSTFSAFGIWDGNSWGSRTVPGYSSFPALTGGITADATFESVSGDVLAVYQAADNNVRYLTWTTSTGWSASSTGPAMGATQTTMRLFSDPTTNHIMLGTITSNRAVSFTDWDGEAWGTRQQMSADSGSTSTPGFTWVWRHKASLASTIPSLWLGSSGTDADGWTGVNVVNPNQVLALSDPNLSFGNGSTGGTFSHVLDSTAWGVSGLDDVAWVSSTVVINPSFTAQRGDVLFTTTNTSTLASLNTVTVNNNDIVVFRPLTVGDYSRGTFTVLFQNVGGGADLRGLALVEQNTVVGDVTLTAGSLLYTAGNGNGNARDIYWFIPRYTVPVIGTVLTNVSMTLVTGAELGINKAITGLELVGTTTTVKNVTLTAGQLLLTMADTATVANTAGISANDVVSLKLTQTSMNGTAQGTSAILLRGSALGISGQALNSLALVTPVGTNAPVITGDTAFTVPEFSTAAITTVTASDLDGNALTYTIVGGADQARFVVDPGTGVLRFAAAPDAHTPGDADLDNIYHVTVRASDGGLYDDRELLVQVQPINRAPVNTLPSASTIAEDTALSLAGLQVLDVDAGSELITVSLSVQHGTLTILNDVAGGLRWYNISYSSDRSTVVLIGSQAAINATLHDINGALYLPDANYNGSDTLTVTTNDQGHSGLPGATASLSDTDTMTITVTAVNDAPVIASNGGSSSATVAVPEFTTAPITTVAATDVDSASLTYSIVGGADQARFVINASTGVLRFVSPPDTATASSYSVVVQASDGTLNDQQALTITLQPVNRAPANTVPGAQAVDEDTPLSLSGLAVSDIDAGTQPIKVTLQVAHGTLSVLANVTGGVSSAGIVYASNQRTVTLTGSQSAINTTLQAANSVLYQADADYSGSDTLTMTSDDLGHSGLVGATPSLQDIDTVAITIAPVTDAPVLTLSPAAGLEDQPIALNLQAVVGDTDPGGGQHEAITQLVLSGLPAGAAFTNTAGDSLVVNGGTLTLGAGQWLGLTMSLPANVHGSWTLTVVATAQDGSAATASTQGSWTVTVDPVNDAPVITSLGGGGTAAVTVPEFTTAVVATVSAGDIDADPLVYSLAGGADQAFFTIDATSGELRFLTPPDTDMASVYTVVVRASDGSLHDEQTVTVTVQHINRAPVNTAPGSLTATEDTPLSITGLQVHDTDAGNLPITVTLQVTHGTLTILAGAPGGLTGSAISYGLDQRSVTLTGSQTAINSTLQAVDGLVYRADPDHAGSDVLTITSNDQGHAGLPGTTPALTDQDTVALTITAVNDAPVINSDGGGATAAITVPEFTTATIATVSAFDIDNTTLSYSLSGGADQALFTIDASTGELRFMSPPDTDVASVYTVVVRVSDGGLYDEQTLTVNVQHINRAPVNTMPDSLTASEDEALAITGLHVTDTDAAGQPITVTLQVTHGTLAIQAGTPGGLAANAIAYGADHRTVVLTGAQAAINATLQATGGVVYLGDQDYSGVDTLTMTSNDLGHSGLPNGAATRSDQDAVGITVLPVTDVPTLTLSPASGLEDQPLALTLQAAMGDTDNSGDQLERIVQVTLSGVPDGASFANASGDALAVSNGVLTLSAGQWQGLTMTPPPDANGSWTLTVQVSAQDGTAAIASTQANWVVTAQAVDDAPVVTAHSLTLQQAGKGLVDLQVRDVDTPSAQLQIAVTSVVHGHFERADTGEVITGFSLASLQSGAIRFAHDGSDQAPSYALTLSDGHSVITLGAGEVRFALLPPTATGPDVPPSQDKPASNSAEAPAEASASSEAPAAGSGDNTPVNAAATVPATSDGGQADGLPTALEALRQEDFRIVIAGGPQFVLDLAPRETPNYAVNAPINIDTSYTWLGSLQGSSEYADELRRNLESLQQQLKEQGLERREVIASSIALTTGLSVGYVIWLVRGGALLGSMLSAMPAWAMIDPMPVLARARAAGRQASGDDQDASVEDLFEDQDAPTPHAPPEPVISVDPTHHGSADTGTARPEGAVS